MKIEIKRSKKDRQWYAHIKARNGRILFTSEGYRRVHSARNAVDALVLGLPGARLVPVEKA